MAQSTNLFTTPLTAWYNLARETNEIIFGSSPLALPRTGHSPGKDNQNVTIRTGQEKTKSAKVARKAIKPAQKRARKIVKKPTRHK